MAAAGSLRSQDLHQDLHVERRYNSVAARKASNFTIGGAVAVHHVPPTPSEQEQEL